MQHIMLFGCDHSPALEQTLTFAKQQHAVFDYKKEHT